MISEDIKSNIKNFFQKNQHIIEKVMILFFSVIVLKLGMSFHDKIVQPIIFNDEYGYWANSSFFLGIDWSSVTSRIPYYSYGYSLMLVLVRLIGDLLWLSSAELYQFAAMWNVCMLLATFWISMAVFKRYFGSFNYLIRILICFTITIYTSNVFYAHITLTETCILLCFWLFLFTLMKVTDKPSVINHIMLSLISFYAFTVHQRTIPILITAAMVVCLLQLAGKSSLKNTAAFLFATYILFVLHSVIKKKLQNDFYLGLPQMTSGDIINRLFCVKNLILLMAVIGIVIIFWLLQNKKYKLLAFTLVFGIVAVVAFFCFKKPVDISETTEVARISINDFSGQWNKIKNLMSVKGMVRLGISIIGKLFYMASATGMLIYWGVISALTGVVVFILKYIKALTKREALTSDDIWKFAVYIVCIGTFMVCAIYKEGFYKNDDLLNGRYNEYIMGILMIISLDLLIKDRKWLVHLIIGVCFYVASGVFCQYAINDVQRTEFEMCHSVMLSRVVFNYTVPVGRLKIVMQYVVPLGTAFIMIVKFFREKLGKLYNIRLAVALLIPVFVWTHISYAEIERYIVGRNVKQAVTMPGIAQGIYSYGMDCNVYFLEDTVYSRNAEGIQFMASSKPVIMTDMASVDFTEEAMFIMNTQMAADNEFIMEHCGFVARYGSYSLLANRNLESARDAIQNAQ